MMKTIFEETKSMPFSVGLEDGRIVWQLNGNADKNAYMCVKRGAFGEITVDGIPVRWAEIASAEEKTGSSGTSDTAVLIRELKVASEDGTMTLAATFEWFTDHPFLRMSGIAASEKEVVIDGCKLFSYTPDCVLPAALFYVEQFSAKYQHDFFRPITARLIPNRLPCELSMGSMPSFRWAPSACTWFAMLHDEYSWYDEEPKDGPGLVTGIEFNGKSHVRAWADDHEAHVESLIDELHHRLRPGTVFEIPASFLGGFHGDWDEAGYRTQRFLEAHVCPQRPDDRYPWVQYNSWAYDQDINEEQQLAAIDICGKLGMELIVFDLGWARNIGDWKPDPEKFPHGFKPLIERAASYGMRFGVHIALEQCSAAAPIAKAHPEWMIGESIDYYGAMGLCLGHAPCRDWLIEQISSLIRDEGINYFVQDGEDMVKRCMHTDHTHEPGDSNYANSQYGIDIVIGTLRERFPDLVVENCEDGGNMMTYKMARLYTTSLSVDNIDTYSTRQGIFGASYPFPPRYSVRYMQDAPTHYSLYSSVFGGPLIFMHRVTEWNAQEIEETKTAIGLYKELRALVTDAKIVHLMRPSRNFDGGYGWDAIQAVNEEKTESVVMVYRAHGGETEKVIRPRGLKQEAVYEVSVRDSDVTYERTGCALCEEGIRMELPELDARLLWIREK